MREDNFSPNIGFMALWVVKSKIRFVWRLCGFVTLYFVVIPDALHWCPV